MVSATALVVRHQGAAFEPTTVELSTLKPEEVLVQLTATGICYTDLKVRDGKISMPYPVVLGHEGAGVVRAVGANVTHLSEGDHVILSYNYCGSCRSCENRQTFHCSNVHARNFGGQRPDGSQTIVAESETVATCFFGQSSFCNPAVVQAVCCVKVHKTFPLSVLCALGCGFQTGAGSVFNVVRPVERKVRYLAVFGVGGVGCAAIMAAHHLAQENPGILDVIIAVDVNKERLKLARELGASHVLHSGKDDLEKCVAEITDDEGLDAAIDCTGVIAVVNAMINYIGQGGIAVSVGGPAPGLKASLNVFGMLVGCKTYQGCHQGNAYSKEFIPFLAALYSKGKLPIESLQKRYKAADINVAVEEMAQGQVIKPILLWD